MHEDDVARLRRGGVCGHAAGGNQRSGSTGTRAEKLRLFIIMMVYLLWSPGLHGTALPTWQRSEATRGGRPGKTPAGAPKGLALTARGPQAPSSPQKSDCELTAFSQRLTDHEKREGLSPHGRDASSGGSGSRTKARRVEPGPAYQAGRAKPTTRMPVIARVLEG